MSTNKSIEISHKGPFSQLCSAPLNFSATTRNIATPITPSNQMYCYEQIKILRLQNKKTQEDIANVLDIKRQQYQRYESGLQEIPFHKAIKLALYYGVSIDFLAGITKSHDSK